MERRSRIVKPPQKRNQSTQTDPNVEDFSLSWLGELKSRVDILFEEMLKAINAIEQEPVPIVKEMKSPAKWKTKVPLDDSNEPRITQEKNLPDQSVTCVDETYHAPKKNNGKKTANYMKRSHDLKDKLKSMLKSTAIITSLVPSPEQKGLYQSLATGSISTPSTQTNPRDTYVKTLRTGNRQNSLSLKNQQVTFRRNQNHHRKAQNNSQWSAENVTVNHSFRKEDNDLRSPNGTEDRKWVKAKDFVNTPANRTIHIKRSYENTESSSSDVTMISAIDHIPDEQSDPSDSEKDYNQELSRSDSGSSVQDEKEFSFPRYIEDLQRIRRREPSTKRAIEFSKGKRTYFDFRDYYDRVTDSKKP